MRAPGTIAAAMFLIVTAALGQSNEDHVRALREQIKGRETEPAADVFKNVQVMSKMPAERFLNVMLMGYSRSLGAGCDHCHTPGKWDDDGKAPKEVARKMAVMVNQLNRDILPPMFSPDRKPVVNCTTCHRGALKPALNLDSPK